MTDQKIVELFWARSQEAVAAAEDKYWAQLYRIARNILRDSFAADECANDALLAAWNSIPPEKPEPLSSWLFAVVRNIAMNRYRVQSAAKRGAGFCDHPFDELDEILSDPHTVESAVEGRELTRLIERFLDKLSREDRFLFLGRYYFGEPYTVLAEKTHLSGDVCRMRMVRIRKKLKQFLGKEGVELI